MKCIIIGALRNPASPGQLIVYKPATGEFEPLTFLSRPYRYFCYDAACTCPSTTMSPSHMCSACQVLIPDCCTPDQRVTRHVLDIGTRSGWIVSSRYNINSHMTSTKGVVYLKYDTHVVLFEMGVRMFEHVTVQRQPSGDAIMMPDASGTKLAPFSCAVHHNGLVYAGLVDFDSGNVVVRTDDNGDPIVVCSEMVTPSVVIHHGVTGLGHGMSSPTGTLYIDTSVVLRMLYFSTTSSTTYNVNVLRAMFSRSPRLSAMDAMRIAAADNQLSCDVSVDAYVDMLCASECMSVFCGLLRETCYLQWFVSSESDRSHVTIASISRHYFAVHMLADNVIVPPSVARRNVDEFRAVKKTGGRSREIVHGIHQNVVEVDFASFYPTICVDISLQLSPPDKLTGVDADATGSDAAASAFQRSCKRLLTLRQADDVPNTQRAVMKILSNSAIGSIGYERCPFYNPIAYNRVTQRGRAILDETASYVEKTMGLSVVGGITDSLFITIGSDTTPGDVVQDIQTFVAATFGDAYHLTSTVYPYFAFLKKHKYIGLSESNAIVSRGIYHSVGWQCAAVVTVCDTICRSLLESPILSSATVPTRIELHRMLCDVSITSDSMYIERLYNGVQSTESFEVRRAPSPVTGDVDIDYASYVTSIISNLSPICDALTITPVSRALPDKRQWFPLVGVYVPRDNQLTPDALRVLATFETLYDTKKKSPAAPLATPMSISADPRM